MKEKRLLKVLGEMDEKYVEEAAPADKTGKADQKIRMLRRGMLAACFVIACMIVIPLLRKEKDQNDPSSGDLSPMVFVNDTLYRQSWDQTGFSELKDEFEYLGEITDAVDSSKIPDKEFQANDPITGAAVYRYGDDIVVRINGKYWLYQSYGKESVLTRADESSQVQAECAADYPLMVMIDGQLYCDSGEIIEGLPFDEAENEIVKDQPFDELDGEIVSSCSGEPTEDNQSNFGTGYGYQYGKDGTILVLFEDGWRVFTPFTARKDRDWDSLSEQEKMEIDPLYHADQQE